MFCPSCGKKIAQKSTFCPYCGQPIASSQGTKPGFAAAPVPGNRRMKKGLPLIVGLVGNSVGICLCLALFLLVDPFRLHLWGRLMGTYDAAATAMPPETSLYLGVNLLNLNQERIREIQQAFQDAARGTYLGDDMNDMEDDFDEIQDDWGINVEEDVLPWIGQYAGFGVIDPSMDYYLEIETADWLLAIETRDKEAADAFLLKLTDGISDNNGFRFDEITYQDVLIYEYDTEELALARSDDLVLIGNGTRVIENAIDTRQKESLVDAPYYQQIVGSLPRNRAVTFVLNPLFWQETSDFLAEELDTGSDSLFSNEFAGLGFSWSLIDEGIQMDIVTAFDRAQIDETTSQLLEAMADRQLLTEHLPEDTVAYWQGNRLDLLWQAGTERIMDSVGRADFQESMAIFEEELGFDPEQDLFVELNGNWTIAIVPSHDSFYAQYADINLGGVWLAQGNNLETLARTAEDIADAMSEEGFFINDIRRDDLLVYEATEDEGFGFGTSEEFAFVGTSGRDIEQLYIHDGSLLDNEAHQQTWRAFPKGMTPLFYLNAAALLDALESSDDIYQEDLPVWRPITAFAGATDLIGQDTVHHTLIVFIETE
ncbi:MAG: DUF3352 domain-containing protein [Chloroflexi bacterium]|nr:DUF3352 domain-containing protein [Chloroflexota bacterium]